MNGSLAQMVALTCHGNASLRGISIPPFLRENSTCQFCNSVTFIAGRQSAEGEQHEFTLAQSPDQWLENLGHRTITGLRLLQQPRNDSVISDRESAGFVGGGRLWKIEGLRNDGTSEFWLNRWEVFDRNAPDKRIWKVTYGLFELSNTLPSGLRELCDIASDLRSALTDIHRFAEKHDLFRQCFADALRAMDDRGADPRYHKDLYPPAILSEPAKSVLKAAQSAWVFGGMESWNDLGFEGDEQFEYLRVSDRLFELLSEAIAAAATSSLQDLR
jgi:hypothetical protein